MKTHAKLMTTAVGISLSFVLLLASLALAAAQQKAGLPVLLTSCGQSPGPTKFDIFLKKLKLDYVYNAQATAADLGVKGKSPFKSIIIVTGASLKGMGAAGVSINDEISRIKALIAEAKKQNIKIIGAHIEGHGTARPGRGAGRQFRRDFH